MQQNYEIKKLCPINPFTAEYLWSAVCRSD